MENIRKELKRIEKENGFKILLAVESGSRVWGLSSEDSDYDIRFIYYYFSENYLRLRDVDDTYNGKKGNYDFQGMDIYKTMHLLRKSNPTLIEWLRSDIIYMERDFEILDKMREYAKENYNPIALFHHYRSMSKSNYYKYIYRDKIVNYKRYVYAFRGLFNALYTYIYNEMPSMDFEKDVREVDFLNSELKNFFLNEAIPQKKAGNDKVWVNRIRWLDEWLETFLELTEEVRPEVSRVKDINKFSEVFDDLLLDLICEG